MRSEWLEGVYGNLGYTFWCSGQGCAVRVDSECIQCIPLTRDLQLGLTVWRPTLPEGWRMVDTQVYCPRHTITVTTEDPTESEGEGC